MTQLKRMPGVIEAVIWSDLIWGIVNMIRDYKASVPTRNDFEDIELPALLGQDDLDAGRQRSQAGFVEKNPKQATKDNVDNLMLSNPTQYQWNDTSTRDGSIAEAARKGRLANTSLDEICHQYLMVCDLCPETDGRNDATAVRYGQNGDFDTQQRRGVVT
jgi:hypothetical protein